jgi:hypothetical protein
MEKTQSCRNKTAFYHGVLALTGIHLQICLTHILNILGFVLQSSLYYVRQVVLRVRKL